MPELSNAGVVQAIRDAAKDVVEDGWNRRAHEAFGEENLRIRQIIGEALERVAEVIEERSRA
jgi:hypothetical protein